MPNALQLLHRAIRSEASGAGEESCWPDLLAAMQEVISAPLSSGAEHLLLSILQYNGRIRLNPSSEFPHSMPPEDMLKSLAAQALAKWTGPTYLLALRRLQARVVSPALASVVRAVVQKLGRSNKQRRGLEGVVENSPEEPSKIRIRPVREESGLTFWADRPIRRQEKQFA